MAIRYEQRDRVYVCGDASELGIKDYEHIQVDTEATVEFCIKHMHRVFLVLDEIGGDHNVSCLVKRNKVKPTAETLEQLKKRKNKSKYTKDGYTYQLWAFSYTNGYEEWNKIIHRENELTTEQGEQLSFDFATSLSKEHNCSIVLHGCKLIL